LILVNSTYANISFGLPSACDRAAVLYSMVNSTYANISFRMPRPCDRAAVLYSMVNSTYANISFRMQRPCDRAAVLYSMVNSTYANISLGMPSACDRAAVLYSLGKTDWDTLTSYCMSWHGLGQVGTLSLVNTSAETQLPKLMVTGLSHEGGQWMQMCCMS
jgi:hypothetical protein